MNIVQHSDMKVAQKFASFDITSSEYTLRPISVYNCIFQ